METLYSFFSFSFYIILFWEFFVNNCVTPSYVDHNHVNFNIHVLVGFAVPSLKIKWPNSNSWAVTIIPTTSSCFYVQSLLNPLPGGDDSCILVTASAVSNTWTILFQLVSPLLQQETSSPSPLHAFHPLLGASYLLLRSVWPKNLDWESFEDTGHIKVYLAWDILH